MATPQTDTLPRRLGLLSAVGIVIGITIGSGIFRTPAVIATRVPDPTLMLLVWVIGGALALCGALALAELAAAFPRTGGLYVYLREGWGRLPAFLFGWAPRPPAASPASSAPTRCDRSATTRPPTRPPRTSSPPARSSSRRR
jgi:hypothetical protein